MKPIVFSLIPLCKSMLSKPEMITRGVWLSMVMGVAEAVSLFLLIPAISALATGEAVWGLSIQAWIICAIILAVFSGLFGYVHSRQGYDTAMNMVNSIHQKIGDQIAKLPLGWFQKAQAGQISRMVSTELMMVGEIIAHLFSPMISRITATFVIMILTVLWDYRLGLILVVSTPIYLLLLSASGALSRKGKKIAEPCEIELSDRIVEFTHSQAALRSCGLSTHYPPLVKASSQWKKAKGKELWFEIAANMVGGVLAQIVVISLIIVAAQLAVSGSLTPIVTVAYIGLALRYAQILMFITEASVGLETRRPLLEAISDVLNAQPLPEPETSAPMPTPGAVELVDVCFAYQPNKPILRNVSLKANAGQMVALVGPSGCGKTTIARLISRFYEVDSGSVKVGGADVRDLTSADLMRQLSMVFQDVYLFDDTLRNNIVIGNPQATAADIDEAARLAGVSEIVDRLPQGWDTPVGEGGRSLSGGERQRVAIARALLKKAPIVLLDEATSALDPENEANIVSAVDKLREHATIIVIAHKLHTIAQADLIVSLTASGTVENVGTHEDLFAQGGTYRSFWDKRSQAQGWRLT